MKDDERLPVPSDGADDAWARLHLVGRSAPFRAALRLLETIAGCDVTALIQGETGTGKELAARAIHYLGARAGYPFLPVNCGALPDSLVENELFGHARGAYTDARDGQGGVVADARGGTLFLDEIETLSPRAQVVLLRFLQDGTYRPLGGRGVLRAEARIIAASNADLHALVGAGRFRADLLYRLDVIPLSMPPLRARGDDVIILAEHFLDRLSQQYGRPRPTLAAACVSALMAHPWPGNVRELENLMHRAFLLAEGGEVHPAVGAPAAEASSPRDRHVSLTQAKAMVVRAFERSFLLRALAESDGNVSAAARRCGKERRSFGKLLKKHGIERPQPITPG